MNPIRPTRILKSCVHEKDPEELKQMMKKIVPEYSPYNERNDKKVFVSGGSKEMAQTELTILQTAPNLGRDLER